MIDLIDRLSDRLSDRLFMPVGLALQHAGYIQQDIVAGDCTG